MNEQTKNYLLIGVTALTVLNTVLIFTTNDAGGRVIEPRGVNAPIIESRGSDQQAQQQVKFDPSQERAQSTQRQEEPPMPTGPKTVMSFAEMAHDFGNIQQNSENKHIFEFTNTGEHPLIIQDAKGSCGCTVPKYPKEPVAPGATGQIEVVYKPGTQKGNQTKTVTIKANTDPYETVLNISAMVEVVDEE